MNLHLVALPHTQVTPDFCGCAYTSKVLKFCKMMGDSYKIFLYAPEGPEVMGAELVPCLSNEERQQIFGKDDPARLPAWPTDDQSKEFNAAAINELKARLEDRDLILLTAGLNQKEIADAFPRHTSCEPGIGYEGWFTKYRAFESYAWMHYTYGKQKVEDGRWFDTVIPNYFDPDDFLAPSPDKKKDYLLYVGRLIARKGVHIAAEIAHQTGLPLYVAGPGGEQVGDDIVAPEVTIKKANYLGPLDIEGRALWMRDARALLCPTTYIEPFGGVAVEAMIAGTPAIATDWGAFTETVEHGVTGFRFRTLQGGTDAVEKAFELDPYSVSYTAIQKYSLKAIAPHYESWFGKLQTLWDKGWYQLR